MYAPNVYESDDYTTDLNFYVYGNYGNYGNSTPFQTSTSDASLGGSFSFEVEPNFVAPSESYNPATIEQEPAQWLGHPLQQP
jgi:hypothetical protein